MTEKYKGNYLLIYCIFRIGLVMTSKMSLFSLQYVMIVGFFVIFLRIGSTQIKKAISSYCNIFLLLEIALIFILKSFTLYTKYINTEVVYIKQLIFLVLLFFMYMYIQGCNKNSQRIYVLLYLFCISLSSCYTLYVSLSGAGNIIRNTAFGVYDDSFALGYGGYDFIYALVIIFVITATYIHRNRNMNFGLRIVLVSFILLVAFTIIASGFSTAFVLIFVFTVFEFVPGKYVKWIVIAFGTLLVYIFPSVISNIINAIPFIPELTSTRVTNTILSLFGKGTGEYISQEGQRLDRILWTLRIFFEHPFFGGFAGNTDLPFGYHTEWLEQMGRYGIFATALNTSFWISLYRNMKRTICEDDIKMRCLRNSFIVYFILGLFDPISMVVTAAPLFVLCPFIDVIDNKCVQMNQ